MKAFHTILLCLAVPLILCGQTPTQSAPILIIDHVTVIDSTGSSPKPDVSVVIEGDRIKSVGPSSRAKRTSVCGRD